MVWEGERENAARIEKSGAPRKNLDTPQEICKIEACAKRVCHHRDPPPDAR